MSSKLKTFLTDLFLILGVIIGMGFASGKEIKVFFVSSKPLAIFSLTVFIVFYCLFFTLISNYCTKYNVKDFKSFNKSLFKSSHKLVDTILIIIYSVCASAMLAGLDSLILTLFNVYIPLSVALSVITFFMVVGGIDRIKQISLKLIPFLLVLVFINLFVNSFYITDKFLNFSKIFYTDKITVGSFILSFTMPLFFLGGNLILAINTIINLKSNKSIIKIVSSIIFIILIFLGSIVAMNDNLNFMPFLNSAKNLSNVFLTLYLFAIVIALISSLVISTHSMYTLINNKNKFTLLIIILFNQILSFCGLETIVKYLYSFSGLLGLIYLIIISVKIIKK